jgi:plasmid stabilization system protein ParE
MAYEVIWSEEAIEELRAICSHVAEHNTDAAVRLGEGILAHTRILARFPFI